MSIYLINSQTIADEKVFQKKLSHSCPRFTNHDVGSNVPQLSITWII